MKFYIKDHFLCIFIIKIISNAFSLLKNQFKYIFIIKNYF